MMPSAQDRRETTLRPAEQDGPWLRPVAGADSEPRWGLADGIQLAIPPVGFPRGLLRIYAPYLDHPRERLVNFIAVEPIPEGSTVRGFSELEFSTQDPGQRGKRLWSADALAGLAGDPTSTARGVTDRVDGTERLTVWIGVEPFDNGADVAVRVRFRVDRPHEIELAGFARDASAPLDRLILTATMGNWARLRRLHLAERTIEPRHLWPGFEGTHFTEHGRFPLAQLTRDGSGVVVTAEGDELDPVRVRYSEDTARHWHYEGRRGVQGWRVDDPHPDLEVLVNGRWAYWASASPIPGGVAFENFEISEPFRQGAAYRFSVEPVE